MAVVREGKNVGIMYIRRKVKFLLHKRKPGEKCNLGIRMRVTIAGRPPIDIPLGHKVDLERWDAQLERVVNGETYTQQQQSATINRTIDEYKSAVNEVFARYELIEKRTPTAAEVKDMLNSMVASTSSAEEQIVTIESAFDEYIRIKNEENNWSKSSLAKNNTIKNHLVACFNNIPFADVTTDTLQNFINYLLHQGLRNTTVYKDYQFVRYFIRWARLKGYYNGNADLVFKPRLKGTDGKQSEIIYLTLEEQQKIRECIIPESKNYLDRVRDVFLFCCYTSLRYSDAKALKKVDIRNNIMHIVTQKTTDGLHIELNKHAQSIIAKYKDVPLPNGAALPVISNQKYNGYLKELGQLAGLDTLTRIVYYTGSIRHDEFLPKYQILTSHCARRTFVVTALQLGIPVEVIIRWTGHADYDAMKPYVAIVDELKKSEMSKFDNL